MRYRVLKGRFDGAAFLADWKAQVKQDKQDYKKYAAAIWAFNGPLGLVYAVPLSAGLRLFGVFEALLSGARQVESTELEGSEGELRQKLLTGRVKGTDLVQVEGGWQTFAQSALFEDTCAEVQHQNRWLARLSWVLSMALGIGLVAGLFWFIVSIPRWLLTVD
jgi:hypothetical protein